MPIHTLKHELTEPEFIADLTQQVVNFLPLLEREEMAQLLESLCTGLDDDIAWLEECATDEIRLRQQIVDSTSYVELGGIHEELNRLEMERFLKVQSVPTLHESCTEYRDLLAEKTMELVAVEMSDTEAGTPPCSYALVSMGSDGREEQTLITDQDYLIVYADGGGPEADDYFRQFSELLVERLMEVGFKKCTGDIMPSNPTWRGSSTQWQRKLTAIVRYEYEDYAKNLMDLIVLSDARYVAGEQELATLLIDLIRGLERDYFQVLWGMAKAATEMRLALGFLKRLWTEGAGEHKGEFNLKLLAWAPLVMNVRILAINQGIPATSTLKRIELLVKEGSFSPEMAHGLSEAYFTLTRQRILLQIKVIKGIQNSSHYLNPYQFSAEEREELRQSILRIEDLQKVIHTNFSIV